MTDVREAILARMLVVAEQLDIQAFVERLQLDDEELNDIALAARNRLTIDPSQRPAIIILDGPEDVRKNEATKRPARAPRIVDMKPTIVIMVGAAADKVGTKINRYRAAYLHALSHDAEFLALTHDNEGFSYDGCTPTYEDGRQIEGQMEFNVTVTYILQPFAL